MGGSSPSNFTSTTAPMTCAMVPILLVAMGSRPCVAERRRASERFGAGYDLDEFLGDDRLARAVVVDREAIDHLAGIARRVVHRRHARALLGRAVFEQRREELHRDVVGQQLLQNLLFIGL